MESIVKQDIANLIDGWLEQESKGVQFPVPFDLAWRIAGYSTKANAKAKGLCKLEKEIDFSSKGMKSGTGGRSSELINLTCDAFKHFCLMARTDEGRQIRQYFIEAEKKWRLVQEHHPEVASDVELLHLKIELTKLEAQKETAIAQAKQADLALTQFRHTIVTTCPEPVQQKVLGYQVIEKTEYVDRVIDKSTGESSDGVGITYIAKALGFKNTQSCWAWLERVGYGKDSGKWQDGLIAKYSPKLSRDDFYQLRSLLPDSSRQLFLGE